VTTPMSANPLRIAAFALALGGCGPTATPTDTGTEGPNDDAVDTADLDWSDSLESDSDQVGITMRRAGTADVVQGVSWAGSETLDVLDTEGGTVLCSYIWPTVSIQPAVGCDECQFAFEIEYGDAELISGTCEDMAGGAHARLGYAAVAWSDAEGADVAGALFVVINDDEWVLTSNTENGVAANTWDGSTFTYSLPDLIY
jgi:hypothetical protein